MKLTELFEVIQSTLAEEGFKLCPYFKNTMLSAKFILNDSDIYAKKISVEYPGETWNGDWIEVNKSALRSNVGYTSSYRLEIISCVRGYKHSISGPNFLRVMCRSLPSTVAAQVKEFSNQYKKYLANKLIMEKLNALLDQT